MSRARLAVPAVALALLAAPSVADAQQTRLTMDGSTSMYPLVTQLRDSYRSVRSSVRILIGQGGSDIGINDAARGRVSIGNASRDKLSSDPSGMVFTPIARDAVCIITNRNNPIANLSQAQVQAIFTGGVRSWSQVPGARSRGAVTIYGRNAASGTADAFRYIFLGAQRSIVGSAAQLSSNGAVRQNVANDPNGIGYVSLDFINGVAPVGLQGNACTLNNAKSGQYQGVRNFNMVTRGTPRGETARFINWVRRDSRAQRVINSEWISLR